MAVKHKTLPLVLCVDQFKLDLPVLRICECRCVCVVVVSVRSCLDKESKQTKRTATTKPITITASN